MSVRPLRYLGDPVLRTATTEVERFDAELAALVEDLVETMYDAEGIGLAAPQVGDGRRVTVLDVGTVRDGSEAIALVNPRIVERRGMVESEEGCLSIPGVIATIERAAEVTVAYRDPTGEPATIDGTELLARALQHEIDHLDGVLFIDHLGSLQRELAVKEFRRTMEELDLPVSGS